MNKSDQIKDKIRKGWRELGFFCDLDLKNNIYKFEGSRSGLNKIIELLESYISNPDNELISEHDHYTPYMYLEIMTWHTPGIDDHSIHGKLSDLNRLKIMIKNKLGTSNIGDTFEIGEDYAENTPFKIVIEVKQDNYDPSSSDMAIK